MSIGCDENGLDAAPAPSGPNGSVVYFDGATSRRRLVTLVFGDRLELHEPLQAVIAWPYDDIRRADSPTGTLRLTCLSVSALARLEIRDAAIAAQLIARCPRLDENRPAGAAPPPSSDGRWRRRLRSSPSFCLAFRSRPTA